MSATAKRARSSSVDQCAPADATGLAEGTVNNYLSSARGKLVAVLVSLAKRQHDALEARSEQRRDDE